MTTYDWLMLMCLMQGWMQGLWFLCRAIASNDRVIFNPIRERSEKQINELVSVIIHEMVHVIQHYRQKHRFLKGKDLEFRSYLDRHKGEYLDTRQKYDQTPDDESQKDLVNRYYDLYYASPQEIAAFAHQAALEIIDYYAFDLMTHGASDLNSKSISNFIDNKIGGRFRNPKNSREAMVRKRYLKLVYQEVIRYIEQRIAKTQKK